MEVVTINGKFYVELNQIHDVDSIVELSIALARENEALRERIDVLEEKLRDAQED